MEEYVASLREAAARASGRVADAFAAASDSARDNPRQAAVIATGVAVAVGSALFLALRSRRARNDAAKPAAARAAAAVAAAAPASPASPSYDDDTASVCSWSGSEGMRIGGWAFKVTDIEWSEAFFTALGLRRAQRTSFDAPSPSKLNGRYHRSWEAVVYAVPPNATAVPSPFGSPGAKSSGIASNSHATAIILTATQGVRKYERSRDLRHIVLHVDVPEEVVAHCQACGFEAGRDHEHFWYARSQDGYNVRLLPRCLSGPSLSLISIRVVDLTASVRFYTKVLGMRKIRSADGQTGLKHEMVAFPDDGVVLELVPDPAQKVVDHARSYGRLIVLTGLDLEEVLARLRSMRTRIPCSHVSSEVHGGARMLVCRDPDGYEIGIVQTGAAWA